MKTASTWPPLVDPVKPMSSNKSVNNNDLHTWGGKRQSPSAPGSDVKKPNNSTVANQYTGISARPKIFD